MPAKIMNLSSQQGIAPSFGVDLDDVVSLIGEHMAWVIALQPLQHIRRRRIQLPVKARPAQHCAHQGYVAIDCAGFNPLCTVSPHMVKPLAVYVPGMAASRSISSTALAKAACMGAWRLEKTSASAR